MESILLVNHHGIGDNIMMSPAVRALKQRSEDLKIFLLVSSEYPAIFDVWKKNPYVEQVFLSRIGFHPRFWNPAIFYLKEYPLILREARKFKRAHGIERIRVVRNQFLPEPVEKRLFFFLPFHRVDRIALELGVRVMDYSYDLIFDESHLMAARTFLREKGFVRNDRPLLVGLHTMPSNAGGRTWPPDLVNRFARRIHDRYGALFILFHDRKSHDLERRLFRTIPDERIIVSTYDGHRGLDILTSAALISLCDIMVCVDSAIAHMASAVRVPLILLCHPKNPLKTRIPKAGKAIGADTLDYSPDLVERLFEEARRSGWLPLAETPQDSTVRGPLC